MTSDERSAIGVTVATIVDECRDRVLASSEVRGWRKPGSGSSDLVTELDMWVEQRIVAGVRAAYPDCTIFSEETPGDPDDLTAPLCFVVDPIDGSSELLAGESTFSISVALLSDGRVEGGLVDFPKLGVRYEARRGAGAWVAGRRLTVRERPVLRGARVAVTPRQRTHPALQPLFARLDGCELIDLRPITAKLTAIASGQVHAGLYVRHPGSEVAIWDYAAAGLILEEAGGAFISLANRRPMLDLLPVRHRDGWAASSNSLQQPLLDAVETPHP